MIIYWSATCGGLLGLAARGPRDGTRITAAVEIITETVWQEWIAVAPEAATAIEGWPCL